MSYLCCRMERLNMSAQQIDLKNPDEQTGPPSITQNSSPPPWESQKWMDGEIGVSCSWRVDSGGADRFFFTPNELSGQIAHLHVVFHIRHLCLR